MKKPKQETVGRAVGIVADFLRRAGATVIYRDDRRDDAE